MSHGDVLVTFMCGWIARAVHGWLKNSGNAVRDRSSTNWNTLGVTDAAMEPVGVSSLTHAERAEIADYMIAKWTRWKDRAGEFARQDGGE